MEELKIYKFQLEAINEALRLTKNIYINNKDGGESCYDRMVNQAKKYTENALNNDIEKRVPYGIHDE